MDGLLIRFYLDESQHCRGGAAWEWLLKRANKMGIRGGSAFRGLAGFGHRHEMHDFKFLEVESSLPVLVEFVVTDDEAAALVELVRDEGIRCFYATIHAGFGVINAGEKEKDVRPAGSAHAP